MKKLLLTIFFLLLLTGCARQVDLGGENDLTSAKLAEKYNASELKNKYQLSGTALKMVAKNDPKDMVRVTVGNDSELLGAETEFEPSVKISRWDEVSMKLTPKGLDKIAKKDKKVKLEDGKIKFETPKENFELYDLPASEDLPEGGYEFEWILKEKPETNTVEFDIEAEGLEFLYQNPLTEQKKKEGKKQKDNSAGSYAVYASEKKINYEGGKIYRTSKVGHIYRPQIIDATGKKFWGEFNKDLNETHKLSVTLPDGMIYPIKHAAGLTFGYTTTPTGMSSSLSTDKVLGQVYASPSGTNTASSISLYTGGWGADAYFKGILVVNSTLNIETNGIGNATINSSGGSASWRTSSFGTTVSLSASTNYLVSFIFNDVEQEYYMDESGPSNTKADITNSYSSPANLGSVSDYDLAVYLGIYVTYTAGGEPPAATPTSAQQIIIFD